MGESQQPHLRKSRGGPSGRTPDWLPLPLERSHAVRAVASRDAGGATSTGSDWSRQLITCSLHWNLWRIRWLVGTGSQTEDVEASGRDGALAPSRSFRARVWDR